VLALPVLDWRDAHPPAIVRAAALTTHELSQRDNRRFCGELHLLFPAGFFLTLLLVLDVSGSALLLSLFRPALIASAALTFGAVFAIVLLKAADVLILFIVGIDLKDVFP